MSTKSDHFSQSGLAAINVFDFKACFSPFISLTEDLTDQINKFEGTWKKERMVSRIEPLTSQSRG